MLFSDSDYYKWFFALLLASARRSVGAEREKVLVCLRARVIAVACERNESIAPCKQVLRYTGKDKNEASCAVRGYWDWNGSSAGETFHSFIHQLSNYEN